MNQPKIQERAEKLILGSRFLTLATTDGESAWSTPLAYVAGPGPFIHFYSEPTSLHAQHIAMGNGVSASLFVAGDEVDGIQVTAHCEVVGDNDVEAVSEHYFTTLFSGDEYDWWHRPHNAFSEGGAWRFYRLSLLTAYVIDEDNFPKDQLDRRVEVDVRDLNDRIDASGR